MEAQSQTHRCHRKQQDGCQQAIGRKRCVQRSDQNKRLGRQNRPAAI